MFEGKEWHGVPGATPAVLKGLQTEAPAGMPASYFALLSWSDGGEGPLPVQPLYFCLDSVSEVVERQQTGTYGQPEFQGVFIFGSNGGGEYLAFDLRQSLPWPVITIDMVAGMESAEVVSEDFDSFLNLVGVE